MRLGPLFVGTCFGWATVCAQADESMRLAQVEELGRMSLEELATAEVTSVSKSPQVLNSAAASIYVIRREDILRAGVLSIPEALRLAPNLQVAQLSSSGYAITARGFGDRRDVQTQANKLLILVDGRSAYSPLFSGIFYDAIDVMMDDIDRIEVISGPGAALWGANAMNGVINIITRSADAAPGALVRVDSGTSEQAASARYAGRLGESIAYRVYGKAFDRHSLELDSGASAGDRWDKKQGGFRLERSAGRDVLTVQGDVYEADQSLRGTPDFSMNGMNVIGRWNRALERSQVMVQVYYDRMEREAPPDGAPFTQDTYDIEFQQTLDAGERHRIVWGAGKRINNYHIVNRGGLQFLPPHRSLDQGNLFAQDTVSIGDEWKVTLGLKLEDNAYSGWSALPDLRVAWSAASNTLLWASAARAIRAPTPFDADVAEFLGGTLFLQGNPQFDTEKVWAYELGVRSQPSIRLSFSVTGFYNDYTDLRTIEFGPTGLPLVWDNRMEGSTYGVEAWASLQVTPWLRLSPGFRSLHKRLKFEPGASGLLGVGQAGNDPTHAASLRSSMDLGRNVSFEAILRHVGELPEPALDDYYELSARLGWQVTPSLDLALSGFNLLHERHQEYPSPDGAHIERSVFVQARLAF